MCRGFILHEYLTAGGIEEAIDEFQGGRLPATAPSEQHQGLALLDFQIEIVEQRPSARDLEADAAKLYRFLINSRHNPVMPFLRPPLFPYSRRNYGKSKSAGYFFTQPQRQLAPSGSLYLDIE